MQKFIVTSDGRFKFGNVNLHRDLLSRGEDCIGGGVFEWDYASHRLLLSGKSYDYGRVKWSYIDQLIIPTALQDFDIFYEDLPLSSFAILKFAD